MEQFVEKNIEIYKSLYIAWQASGFQRRLSPFVDRVNNDGDYTLENIELVPITENIKKLHRYKKEKGLYLKRKQAIALQ